MVRKVLDAALMTSLVVVSVALFAAVINLAASIVVLVVITS